mmetsp:Transcript_36401/g.84417  ORF Transcript_36401/g.84417 Transcript_36401/m.84417 type:complete len:129 (-) Transcript_36401:623-1009(-)
MTPRRPTIVLAVLVLATSVLATDYELATVLIMRHGEKTEESDTGLSPEGLARAQYIAQCIGDDVTTHATPLGPVSAIMVSATRDGKSHRTRDTVMPLAKARGLIMNDTIDKKKLHRPGEHCARAARQR